MAIHKTASDWTPKEVSRLWNWHASQVEAQSSYFTYQVGQGIVNFLGTTGKLRGQVLDYGCGAGYLVTHLLKVGLSCSAVDISEESIAKVNQVFNNHPNWQGGVAIDGSCTPYPDNYFDVVTCVETVEHLADEYLGPVLSELRRVVKPGGIVLVTTPFAENLQTGFVYCPFCDSEYHRWQHMRTLTTETLCSLLHQHGLKTTFCQNMSFEEFQRSYSLRPLRMVSPDKVYHLLKHKVRVLLDRLSPAPFPDGRETQWRLNMGHGRHLCAISTKDVTDA